MPVDGPLAGKGEEGFLIREGGLSYLAHFEVVCDVRSIGEEKSAKNGEAPTLVRVRKGTFEAIVALTPEM